MDIKHYLKEHHVPFDVIKHERTETAVGTAELLDVPEENFAKSVLMKVDGDPVIAVVQSPDHVNPQFVKNAFGAGMAELANEEELQKFFSDCETGAVPPFGSPYGVPVIVDTAVADDEYIVFHANNHHEAIAMRCRDYLILERPQEAPIRDTSYESM